MSEYQSYTKLESKQLQTESLDYTDAKVKEVETQVDKKLTKINTIAELRNTTGEYEGQIIELLGYYEAGQYSLKYQWTTKQGIDDGGSVINSGNGSWLAQFESDLVDVKYFGFLKNITNNQLDKWQKINSYCFTNNKIIYLSFDVMLQTSESLKEIFTANIRGSENIKLYLDGKFRFRTDNLLNVDISEFTVVVKNNYTTLTSVNDSTTIFYNPSDTYNSERKVSYTKLTCLAEAPLYDGSNRLAGFIRDGGYNSGLYEDIFTNNVSNIITTNSNQSSRNQIIQRVTGYNFGTLVWAQGENQECYYLKGINTPEQANNWVGKNSSSNPRLVNGLDVLLAEGNGIKIDNIHAENPIERVVYIQCSNVIARNLYSLNGDGFKFVGKGYNDICSNIYIDDVILEWDNNFKSTFNHTAFQIYWVDNYNVNNITVINNNITSTPLLIIYAFARTAKNINIKNVTMKGLRGCISSIGQFNAHDETTAGTIPYENITIENVKGIRSTGRKSATFNHYYTTPSEVLVKNMKITDCYVGYQKISEEGDDFLYRWDFIDGFEARNNTSNVRGNFNHGMNPLKDYSGSSNILIQEDILKASSLDNCITATNKALNLLNGSYLNFEISKGNNLKAIYKNTGINYYEWIVENTSYTSIIATDKTIIFETETKQGFAKSQVVSNVKTDLIGTPPSTLINYTNGSTNFIVRGENFSSSYKFKSKIFL